MPGKAEEQAERAAKRMEIRERKREQEMKVLMKRYLDWSVEAERWLKSTELKERDSAMYARLYRFCGNLTEVRIQLKAQYPQATAKLEGTAKSYNLFTMEKLMNVYYDKSVAADHWLSLEEVDADESLPCAQTFSRHGGIRYIRDCAYEKFGEVPWESKEDLAERYYQESKKRGCWLNLVQVDVNENMPTARTLYYFTTLRELRKLVEMKHDDVEEWQQDHGRQNATPEEERIAQEYFQKSRQVGKWLPEEAVPSRVLKSFGGIKALRRHVTAKEFWMASVV